MRYYRQFIDDKLKKNTDRAMSTLFCFARLVTSGDTTTEFEAHMRQISEVQKKLKNPADVKAELELLVQQQNLMCNLFTDLFTWSEQMSKSCVETNQHIITQEDVMNNFKQETLELHQ